MFAPGHCKGEIMGRRKIFSFLFNYAGRFDEQIARRVGQGNSSKDIDIKTVKMI